MGYLPDHGLPLVQLKEQRRDLVVALQNRTGPVSSWELMQIAAIQQALAEAGLQASEVDLICGTSWGTGDSAQKELDAVRAVFGALAAEVPLVNYNGHFGFVESAAGLLNPMVAGAAMALSSVSVLSNALLLNTWKPGTEKRS